MDILVLDGTFATNTSAHSVRQGQGLRELRGGYEGGCHSRPISGREIVKHRFPRDCHGSGTGGKGMAPAVVLINWFRPARTLSVKYVGVEELSLPDESRTRVLVPDHFLENNLVRSRRSDSEGHGQIARY